jgi:thymidylate kinase
MKRIDLMGVPGVGKTTTYNLLGQCRENASDYLLFEEAYRSVIIANSSSIVRYAQRLKDRIKQDRLSIILKRILNKWLDYELRSNTYRIERDNLKQAIKEMKEKYPDFLEITLPTLGKPPPGNSLIRIDGISGPYNKTISRLNQFFILQRFLENDTRVIFDNSFSHKVFSIVNFNQTIDPGRINQYIQALPRPEGTVIFIAPPEIIINRIRERANYGVVNTWHRQIVDTDLLEDWVKKGCDIARMACQYLREQDIPVLELDAQKEPLVLSKMIGGFILALQ